MKKNETTPRRKGARTMAEIPAKVLASMNRGDEETLTLVEMLAVDQAKLASSVDGLSKASLSVLRAAKGEGITKRMALGGRVALSDLGLDGVLALREHRSDLVRGWAAYAIGMEEGVSIRKRMAMIRPLADDAHSGVREWAWMGVRARIAEDLDGAIATLTPWVRDDSANVRRFATEATRPRGVWCAHIGELRREPERAIGLLEPLRDDPTKYVQDSVANWLNDASKDRPDWVRDLCARWVRESPAKATERIAKRAMRTLTRE
jgi:3-methyladenine DNA glycosylase AlkC